MNKIATLLFLLLFTVSASERSHYTFLNCASIIYGELAIGYQRIIMPKQSLGILACYRSLWDERFTRGLSVLGSYNFYSKESFRGLWLSPSTGIELTRYGNNVPVLTGVGYHWITRSGFSLGFNFAFGVYIVYESKLVDKLMITLPGIIDVGYAF
ncbi:MAG: hypothetical protein GX556_00685 [Fibrobacter sp.]|nr:hypothetical protein [Fibrobacter sp.]